MVTIRVAETFTSIQGEGHLVGKVTHFIRLAGCSVWECGLHPASGVPWGVCDEIERWKRGEERLVWNVADEAVTAVGINGWACLTGGEPMDQAPALRVLVAELKRRDLLVSVQTSGTRVVQIPWDWLSVSPKGELKQLYGQELKVVYHGQPDDELYDLHHKTRFWDYYLMPLASADGSFNTEDTMAAVRRLYRRGQHWAFTSQAHKAWGVR